jgi:hypothetical protein
MPYAGDLLDKLPFWNKEIAKGLSPVEPYINLVLIGIALLCILAIFYLKSEHKLLFSAFLISP